MGTQVFPKIFHQLIGTIEICSILNSISNYNTLPPKVPMGMGNPLGFGTNCHLYPNPKSDTRTLFRILFLSKKNNFFKIKKQKTQEKEKEKDLLQRIKIILQIKSLCT